MSPNRKNQTVAFDAEMIDIINQRALFNGRSFSGEIRFLLEIALTQESHELMKIIRVVQSVLSREKADV